MASVWYVGGASQRIITAAQWAGAGVAGATDSIWNQANGWSIPKSNFSAAQLTILGNHPGQFDVNAPDGPRGTSENPTPDTYVKPGDLVTPGTLAFEALRKLRGGIIARMESRGTIVSSFQISPSVTLLPSCSLRIPPSLRAVEMEVGAAYSTGTAGAGVLELAVYNITGGGAVLVDTAAPMYQETGKVSAYHGEYTGRVYLGPSTTPRLFALYGRCVRESGSGLVGGSLNSNGAGMTWMQAVVR